MKFSGSLASAALTGALLFAGPANAQDEDLSYRDAMKCSAIHAYIAGVADANGEGGPAAVAKVKRATEIGTRWMILAIFRDGNGGETAAVEMDMVVEALLETLTELEGGDEDAAEFLTLAEEHCLGLQQANADEFERAGEFLTD